MDSLKHLGHSLYTLLWHNRKNVTVKMHRTTLIFCIREDLADSFDHPKGLVSNNKFNAIQTALFEPYKEVIPTFDVFLKAFGSADDFAVSSFLT